MGKYDTITQAAIDVVAANYSQIGHRPSLATLQEAIEAKHPGAIERRRAARKKAVFENKFIGPVPDWAKRYVAKYGYDVSSLTVRQSRIKSHSSGHCSYGQGRMVVTFGTLAGEEGEIERKATILHEIAHSKAKWDGHGDRFYDAWTAMLRSENLYRAVLDHGRFVGVSSLRAAARRARAAKPKV